MASVDWTEGQLDWRSVQDDDVRGVEGTVILTDIDVDWGDQFENGRARCYDWGLLGSDYLGLRTILGNGNDEDVIFTLAAAPPPDIDYVYVYDDDVDPASVDVPQNPPPLAVPKVQPQNVDWSLVGQSDYLPAACIVPEALGIYSSVVPFRLYTTLAVDPNPLSDGKQVDGGELFWVITVAGAYQAKDFVVAWFFPSAVNDPDCNDAILGQSLLSGDDKGGCMILFETVRDWAAEDPERGTFLQSHKYATAHEIGHLVGNDIDENDKMHEDGGVMDPNSFNPATGDPYTNKSLRRFMLLKDDGPSW